MTSSANFNGTRGEYRDKLGVCIDTVDALVRKGRIKSIMIGSRLRRLEPFEDYIARELEAQKGRPKRGRPTKGEVQRRRAEQEQLAAFAAQTKQRRAEKAAAQTRNL